MATHPTILAWKIPWARGVWPATVYEATNSQTQLSDLSTELSKRLNILQATETDVITRFLGTDKGVSDQLKQDLFVKIKKTADRSISVVNDVFLKKPMKVPSRGKVSFLVYTQPSEYKETHKRASQ